MPIKIIPIEIQRQVLVQQEAYDWPKLVPKYAFLPPDCQRVKLFRELTVGECEQLVEFHIRRAIQHASAWNELLHATFGVFHAYRRRVLRDAAAESIVLARLFRCQSFTLRGLQQTTEEDMPFPHFALPISDEELEAMAQ